MRAKHRLLWLHTPDRSLSKPEAIDSPLPPWKSALSVGLYPPKNTDRGLSSRSIPSDSLFRCNVPNQAIELTLQPELSQHSRALCCNSCFPRLGTRSFRRIWAPTVPTRQFPMKSRQGRGGSSRSNSLPIQYMSMSAPQARYTVWIPKRGCPMKLCVSFRGFPQHGSHGINIARLVVLYYKYDWGIRKDEGVVKPWHLCPSAWPHSVKSSSPSPQAIAPTICLGTILLPIQGESC